MKSFTLHMEPGPPYTLNPVCHLAITQARVERAPGPTKGQPGLCSVDVCPVGLQDEPAAWCCVGQVHANGLPAQLALHVPPASNLHVRTRGKYPVVLFGAYVGLRKEEEEDDSDDDGFIVDDDEEDAQPFLSQYLRDAYDSPEDDSDASDEGANGGNDDDIDFEDMMEVVRHGRGPRTIGAKHDASGTAASASPKKKLRRITPELVTPCSADGPAQGSSEQPSQKQEKKKRVKSARLKADSASKAAKRGSQLSLVLPSSWSSGAQMPKPTTRWFKGTSVGMQELVLGSGSRVKAGVAIGLRISVWDAKGNVVRHQDGDMLWFRFALNMQPDWFESPLMTLRGGGERLVSVPGRAVSNAPGRKFAETTLGLKPEQYQECFFMKVALPI